MNPRPTLSVLCLAALGVVVVNACSGGSATPSPSIVISSPPLEPLPESGTLDGGEADAYVWTIVPTDPPLCTSVAWSGGTKLVEMPASRLTSFAALAGITPLGRTVAWIEADGRLFVADANEASQGFGDAKPVDTGSPGRRAALHPAGALLVSTNPTRSGLIVYERPFRMDSWTGPSTLGLEVLDAQLVALGATVSEMTIGGSPGSLFLLLDIAGAPALYESAFDAQTKAWGLAVVHEESAVGSEAGKLRRPTGLSWDGRTLFFFDESAGVTRAAWRAGSSGPFETVVDVGAFPEAIPDQACSRLYYVDVDHDADVEGLALFSVTVTR